MEDGRIDAALNELSKYRPRAPAKLVNDMVFTVNKLDTEREKRISAAKKKPEMKKQAAPKQKNLGEKKLKPPGMTR